jgi:hypothetical protein
MEAQKDDLLTPAEVAKLFRVDPKTVTRWAKAGSFPRYGPWVDIAATARKRSPGFSREPRQVVRSCASRQQTGSLKRTPNDGVRFRVT